MREPGATSAWHRWRGVARLGRLAAVGFLAVALTSCQLGSPEASACADSADSARTTYVDKPNTPHGSMPVHMDTGQRVSYYSGAGPGASGDLFVRNGELVFAGGGDERVAGYVAFCAASAITHMGVRFTLDSTGGQTTPQGAVALAIANMPFTGVQSINNPAMRLGVHLVVGSQGYMLNTFDATTQNFALVGSGNFQSPLETNGSTVYELQLWRAYNTLTIALPDGNVVTLTDRNISAWSGSYGFYENFQNVGATDYLPAIREAWWSSAAIQHPPTG